MINTEKNAAYIDSFWNYNKPDESEKKFRELLFSTDIKQLPDTHIQVLTQIARAQGLQRKFDDSHSTLDLVSNLITDDTKTALIRYHLERGRAFNSSGKTEKSKSHFLQAYKLAVKQNQDFYAIDAAHMLGIVEDADKALIWNEIAIHLAEDSKDKRSKKWLGSLYNNTGWTYHDKQNYEKALEFFEKNVDWHSEMSKDNKKSDGYYIAKWTVARVMRSMERVQEAYKMQCELLDEKKHNNVEPSGYESEEIGECLLLMNKKNESKKYFADAYASLSKDIWLQANEKERLDRILSLSK
ncbi:tetratricopeptide repeat protein [soil metagenome]